MTEPLRVAIGGQSIAGRKPVNQDAFAARHPGGMDLQLKGVAAVMCDGVSSSENAEIASQTAVTNFIEDYFSTPPTWSVRNAASRVLNSLNNWLYRQNSARKGARDDLLTTFSAAIIKSNTLHVFHVGDTRIYHLRGDQFEQLTHDHVRTQGGREFLARALGADSHLEVDYLTRELLPGDRILLSSDGVHGVLETARLREALSTESNDLEASAGALVSAAAEAGSEDNLSALILRIDALPLESLEESHRRLTALPIPPVLSVGNRIDGFEVLDVIFSGTRSHMYLVKDIDSGQRQVLKAPSLNFAEDAVYLDGFIREEWVGQRIDHANVMKTYAPPRPKQFLYYLGEHIEGRNLREWMQDHPHPPLDQVRDIMRQIIGGLRAFQRAEMIHQDLKPENIMINRDGRVKILDFGTVLIAGTDEIASPLDKAVPQGSVNYIAPEYLVGNAGSFRSDLFSLAVIVYELVVGALPFHEPAIKRTTLDGYHELEYLPANHRRRDLPLWIEACLRKALQANPAYRYDSFSEFMQDFSQPNATLEAGIRKRPLIERNPVRFWKIFALLLFALNIIQLLLAQQ